MAITYPLTMPQGDPGPSRIIFRAKNIVGQSRSPFSGSQQVYLWPGEWWEAEVTLPQMVRANAELWLAFLISLRGAYGTFLLGDPGGVTPRGLCTGTPVVNGANQSGIQLATRGWTPNTYHVIFRGDYLQLGPSTAVPSPRLYKVMYPMSSDSNGNATLDIFPRLRESPADGDAITVLNCVGTFRLAVNQTEWDLDSAFLYGLSFKCVEAI